MRGLNQRTSKVVRDVAVTRRTLTITSNGKPVGVELVPATRSPGILDQLVVAGRATAPTVHGPIKAPADGVSEVDVAAQLAADRNAERW